MEPSFDKSIHLKTPLPTPEQEEAIQELYELIIKTDVYKTNKSLCDFYLRDRQILMHFLVGKSFDMVASYKLIMESLEWRIAKGLDLIEEEPRWDKFMENEIQTGKIYNPGVDKWGRQVVIFDNSVQNTKSASDQMKFLAWSLNFAVREMEGGPCDKYVIFMHLTNFSIFKTPSWEATTETAKILCSCFPERMGHCIAFGAGPVFRTFFNAIKPFIDPRTRAKVLFMSNDSTVGGSNDVQLTEILGEQWRSLTGADQPLYAPNSSPGYNHSEYWPKTMKRVQKRRYIEKDIRKNILGVDVSDNIVDDETDTEDKIDGELFPSEVTTHIYTPKEEVYTFRERHSPVPVDAEILVGAVSVIPEAVVPTSILRRPPSITKSSSSKSSDTSSCFWRDVSIFLVGSSSPTTANTMDKIILGTSRYMITFLVLFFTTIAVASSDLESLTGRGHGASAVNYN